MADMVDLFVEANEALRDNNDAVLRRVTTPNAYKAMNEFVERCARDSSSSIHVYSLI